MSLGDFIRNFFTKRANPELGRLQRFASEHKGVEGFIEPKTATEPTTLLLVDRNGAHVRSPVREPQEGAAFCERLGIPVYDAAVIGYPQRMRDYDEKRRGGADALDERFAEIERTFNEEPGGEGGEEDGRD